MNLTQRIKRQGIVGAAAIALLGVTVFTGSAGAQTTDMSHPAHIHDGTCVTLGAVVYPLSNVGSGMLMNGTPMASMDMGTPMAGAAMSTPTAGEQTGMMQNAVEASVTDVNVSIQDLLAGTYAINVHESMANIQNYIACGDITGSSMMGSALAIPLHELNNSGYSGIAVLKSKDSGTEVTILLAQGLSGGGMMATPTS